MTPKAQLRTETVPEDRAQWRCGRQQDSAHTASATTRRGKLHGKRAPKDEYLPAKRATTKSSGKKKKKMIFFSLEPKLGFP